MTKRVEQDTSTDTSRFILPAFKLSKIEWFKLGFENCYLKDKDRDPVNDKDIHIYFLFKPCKELQVVPGLGGFMAKEKESQYDRLQKKIQQLEEKQESLETRVILDDYDYPDGYVVLVLKLQEKFRKVYELFLKGKYSKFPDFYKQYFPANNKTTYVDKNNNLVTKDGPNLPYAIIYHDEQAKQFAEKKWDIQIEDSQEFWRLPDLEKREVLDIAYITEQDRLEQQDYE